MLFYFDVRDDGQLYPDEEGQELPHLEAARREAAEAALAIAGDVLPLRHVAGEVIVEVRDQDRELLATVSVELRIATLEIPKP